MERTSPTPWLVGAALVIALAAPALATHGGDAHITLRAQEGGDCPDGDNFCYEVASGDPADVARGNDVQLTFENPSSNGVQHNVHVADASAANQGQSTSAGAAFADVDTRDPGQSQTITFTVPSDVDGTYLWCTIGNHEAGGMWLLGGAAAADDGGGDGGDDGANGSPAFTALATLAAAGAALALARRRR